MAVRWKEGTVISIETRRGVYVLAQMLMSPYLMIFDAFRTDEDWSGVVPRELEVLFIHAVTRQFTSQSIITKQSLPAVVDIDYPKQWILSLPVYSDEIRTIWEGTPHERRVMTEIGGALVYDDIAKPGIQEYKFLIKNIPHDDHETIDRHELKTVEIFPGFNERLYLCYLLGKKIDPEKDLMFGRDLPLECARYVDLRGVLPGESNRRWKEIKWEDYSLTPEEVKLGKRIKKR